METRCLHCDRPVFVVARQLCRAHYKRWHRYGDAAAGASYFHGESVPDRLVRYSEVSGTGCLEWTGAKSRKGYGNLFVDGKSYLAHRLAYEAWVGPIPDGLWVLHSCDNPPCINPEHLRVGTHQDNTDDMMSRGRDRHPRGVANKSAKLTDEQVREMRTLYAAGNVTQVALGQKYGINQTVVSDIVRRQTWKHVE